MDQILANSRHSLAHLLAIAAQKHDEEALLTVGPATEHGFFYDIKFSEGRIPSPEDLKVFEKTMRGLIHRKLPFTRREVTVKEAKELFGANPFKMEIIEGLEKDGATITVYDTGDFTDLCEGPHVTHTGEIDPEAFKLTTIGGAYWHGDEKNPMLTRISGVAFGTKEALDTYLTMVEEAKKRDHKKLGRELDLFVFSDLVGAGLPLWTPKGTLVRNLLDSYVWELRKEKGYDQVDIPHITKKELYETSGHWDKFQEELFKVTTREGHFFAMKPMNCPHHTQIYARKQWSYREIPQRYATTTKVYRDEQSGELNGLARVRAITQDDAHVFCRKNQIETEVFAVWDIIDTFYSAFGFADLKVRFSRHDPEQFGKYLGTKEIWEAAESQIRNIIDKRGYEFIDGPGEAAMYGPKIDFMAKDSIGRELQVATIQLDFNMPERFDLSCVNEGGERERIAMIHCAIMGSIERFLAVLIEHFAGAFPLWLAPVQVKVLPISEHEAGYALTAFDALKESGIRAEFDDTNETLGKKIRNAKQGKVPYLLVIGKNEVTNHTVTLEGRTSKIGELPLTDVIARLREEIDAKSLS
jgi:threonyl-tRNA synthetase